MMAEGTARLLWAKLGNPCLLPPGPHQEHPSSSYCPCIVQDQAGSCPAHPGAVTGSPKISPFPPTQTHTHFLAFPHCSLRAISCCVPLRVKEASVHQEDN